MSAVRRNSKQGGLTVSLVTLLSNSTFSLLVSFKAFTHLNSSPFEQVAKVGQCSKYQTQYRANTFRGRSSSITLPTEAPPSLSNTCYISPFVTSCCLYQVPAYILVLPALPLYTISIYLPEVSSHARRHRERNVSLPGMGIVEDAARAGNRPLTESR